MLPCENAFQNSVMTRFLKASLVGDYQPLVVYFAECHLRLNFLAIGELYGRGVGSGISLLGVIAYCDRLELPELGFVLVHHSLEIVGTCGGLRFRRDKGERAGEIARTPLLVEGAGGLCGSACAATAAAQHEHERQYTAC